MAMSKTIILISQGSNFNCSCLTASLNREYSPKCGKKYMVLQNNCQEKLFLTFQQPCFSLDQLRSLCTTQKRAFSGSSRAAGFKTCPQAIWPHLIAFEECCWACLTQSPGQAALAGGAPGGSGGGVLPCCRNSAFPQKGVTGFQFIYIFYYL